MAAGPVAVPYRDYWWPEVPSEEPGSFALLQLSRVLSTFAVLERLRRFAPLGEAEPSAAQ